MSNLVETYNKKLIGKRFNVPKTPNVDYIFEEVDSDGSPTISWVEDGIKSNENVKYNISNVFQAIESGSWKIIKRSLITEKKEYE